MYKKIIERLLDEVILSNSQSFRDYIQGRVWKLGHYDFECNTSNITINQVLGEYNFYDMQPDDVVLDIGANVGAFSLFVSNTVKKVYAVEPLYTNILKRNINKNCIKNVKVLNYGLGDVSFMCEFMNMKKFVKTKTLSEIMKECNEQITFLKCDCEGGEWSIKPDELKGIRRIEAELHSFNGENMMSFVKMLRDINYKVTITDKCKTTMLIHAHKINILVTR